MTKPKWFMAERGKRWCYCLDEKTLGVVVWNFCGWDAYLLFDQKWPKDKKSIHYHSPTGSNTCWEARRAVENAVAEEVLVVTFSAEPLKPARRKSLPRAG